MSVPRLALIVAAASNDVIGRGGELPWHLPADLRHFRELTMGKPIVMGRRTFESIGRPLPGRTNIVVTRDAGFHAAGVRVVHDLDQALALAREVAAADGSDEIMVIGGGDIYARLLPSAERIYLTRLHMAVDGDTFLPKIDWEKWKETAREDVSANEGSPCDYSFLQFDRQFASLNCHK